MNFLLGRPMFRGCVSFTEGIQFKALEFFPPKSYRGASCFPLFEVKLSLFFLAIYIKCQFVLLQPWMWPQNGCGQKILHPGFSWRHSYIQLVLKIIVPLDRSFATNNKPLRTPSVFTKPIQEQFDMIQPVPVNVVIEYRFLWVGPTKGNDSMTWTCLRWFVTKKGTGSLSSCNPVVAFCHSMMFWVWNHIWKIIALSVGYCSQQVWLDPYC